MSNAFFRDAVLRLLPDEIPLDFLRLDPAEQAWRGRAWLILFGAGYEPVHAWWFVLSGNESPESAEWIAFMKATVARIENVAGDGEYAKMLQGRLTYEAGKAMVGGAVARWSRLPFAPRWRLAARGAPSGVTSAILLVLFFEPQLVLGLGMDVALLWVVVARAWMP